MALLPIPGFYVAQHPWLASLPAFKVGFSADLRCRLTDSCYTTCFAGPWRYRATLEVATPEEAHSIETAVLFCADGRRVEGKELLRLDLEVIVLLAEKAAEMLGIRYRLARDPAYELHPRERRQDGGSGAGPGADEKAARAIQGRVAPLRQQLEAAAYALPLPEARSISAEAPLSPGLPHQTPALRQSQPHSQPPLEAEFADEIGELAQSLGELLELADRPLDVGHRGELEDRAYQKAAIAACCAELERSGRAILQMACRCGKTRVGYGVAEWAAAAGETGAVLFLVPGLPLLRQTAQKLLSYGRAFSVDSVLLVGSDPTAVQLGEEKRDVWMTTDPHRIAEFVRREGGGRRLVVCTYQSSLLIPPDACFSLLVFDEAHRVCGGGGPRPFNCLLLSSLPGRRLFLTATPAFEAAEISMKDRALFGGVAYRYYLRQGIEAGYVNDFQLRLVAAADRGGVSDEALASQILAAAAEAPKLLVFARDIKQAERLRGLVEEALPEAGIFPPCDLLCAHSRLPPADIAGALRRFCQEGRRSVLFNCRMFQEGVELPQLNAIFFASPRHSFRDIIQSLCRPLNRLPGKPVSTVYLPVNVEPDADYVDPANLQRYASLVEVFDALVQEDPRLFDYLLDAGGQVYPISCLGTKSLGLATLEEKRKLLEAVRRAVRYGRNGRAKLAERLLRTEAIPWELGFGELARIVRECKRYPKTTDGFRVGSAVINFYRFYQRCQEGYALWKAGQPTFLEPFQLQALASLPSWEPFGLEGPYPWAPCMRFLENWLEEHEGEPPPVEIHKGGYVGLNASWMERLSGVLTCCNQADGKRRGASAATGYTLPLVKQEDLARIAKRFGLRWCKERDERGELVENGPKTFIQLAYDSFRKIYEARGPRDPYIRQWYSGYPHKHSVQEDPSVPRALLPPRYKVEKKKLLKAMGEGGATGPRPAKQRLIR